MVSASKLLQVLVKRFEVPHPDFTSTHAYLVLRFINKMGQKSVSREDLLTMMGVIAHCPHALSIYKNNQRLCEKLLLMCFACSSRGDIEAEDGVRLVIHAVSVNNQLNTNIMMTMCRKLAASRWTSATASKRTRDRSDDVANELLRRIVTQMPAHGGLISEGDCGIAFLTQKAMHKRRQRGFERPELFFLASTLRCVAAYRQGRPRERDGGAETRGSASDSEHWDLRFLPSDVVEPFVRCVVTLPVFSVPEVPMRPDDWYLLANLIACPDRRLRPLGIRLWKQKAQHCDPLQMNLTLSTSPFPLMLAGFLVSMRGDLKGEAIMLWLGSIADPAALQSIDEKVLQLLLLDLAQYSQTGDLDDDRAEQVSTAQLAILKALESSTSPVCYLDARMTLTRTSRLLNTSNDLVATLRALKDVLSKGEVLRSQFLRATIDFLRYVRQNATVNEQSYFNVLMLLVGNVLHALRVTSVEEYTSTLAVVLATIVSFYRELQMGHHCEQREENNVLLKSLVISVMNEPSLVDPNVVSLYLQMMELLDFSSDEQYTTTIRERIVMSLRAVSNKAREVTLTTAQHCYDLVLRSVHFHVLDEEILSEAIAALRHATDTTAVMDNMPWAQRRYLLDRCSALYRDLATMLTSSRGARRLAKQMLTVATIVSAEKHAPRPTVQRRCFDARRPVPDTVHLLFCAESMWTLVLRASLNPIPNVPMDRYLASMLRFVKKHWVGSDSFVSYSEETRSKGKVTAVGTHIVGMKMTDVDEKFSGGVINTLLGLLHQLITLWFTNRTVFQANVRRHKAIITTACEVIERNSVFLTPRAWFEAQRVLCALPVVLPNQCTTLHLSVLRRALQETLYNVRACGNKGTWHLSHEKAHLKAEGGSADVILGGRAIADMFACAHVIEDADLEVYLINLAAEQLKAIDDADETDEDDLTPEEKSAVTCLSRIMPTIRHGVVLYY